MARVKYLGPANRLTVGNKEYAQGDTVTLTVGQVRGLMASGHTFEDVGSETDFERKENKKDSEKDNDNS